MEIDATPIQIVDILISSDIRTRSGSCKYPEAERLKSDFLTLLTCGNGVEFNKSGTCRLSNKVAHRLAD